MAETVAYSSLLEGDARRGILHVAERLSHDFGNLLMPLLEYPQLIRMDLAPGARAGGLLDSVERTARDIEHISSQLAALADESGGRDPVDLNRVIRDVVRSVGDDGQAGPYSIRCELFPELPAVQGTEVQLFSAVQNLVLNGMEALSKAGDLVTVTSSLSEHESWSGPALCVRVADTGGGVDPSVAATMFDPFVTTKKRGNSRRGAGLGLSIAYVVARAHDGEIRFESEPGRGSCFSLLIPAGA